VSLRNQPIRSGLVAGFAVVLLGSFVALGCVQGPKGAFNRVWGPDSVASKTAKGAKKLVSFGRDQEKSVDEKQALAGKTDDRRESTKRGIAQVSGEKPASRSAESAGRARISKHSAVASAAPKGAVVAPFVQKRAPKSGEVQDPFLDEFKRVDLAKTERAKAPAGKAPSAGPVIVPGTGFVPGFDAQMAQIRASVAQEQAAVEKAKLDREKIAAARIEVEKLLKQAHSADEKGQMEQAVKLARAADNLAHANGVLFAPNEDQPEDLLQRLRDKKVRAIAAQKKAEALIAAGTPHVDVAHAAAAPSETADSGLRHANEFIVNDTLSQPAAPAPKPALAAAAPALHDANLVRPAAAPLPERHSQPGVTVVRSRGSAHNEMIVDSRTVDWRFPERVSSDVSVAASSVGRTKRQSTAALDRAPLQRGAVVNAAGTATRFTRGDSDDQFSSVNGLRWSSHVDREGESVKAGRWVRSGSPDDEPEFLQPMEEGQAAPELLDETAAAPHRAPASSSPELLTTGGQSFLIGLGVAAAIAVGLGLWHRKHTA